MSDAKSLAKGAVAGLAAGIVASAAMELFQRAASAAMPKDEGGRRDPATVKAAHSVARAVTGKPVPYFAKGAAGEAVHYATGAGLGMLYGALAEATPIATAGAGTGYALATWAALDEGAVPLAGWSGKPSETPASLHLYGLASHLVYGVTLEWTRRLVRDRL